MKIYATYDNNGDLVQFAEEINCATEPYIECSEDVRTRFNSGIFTDKVKNGLLYDISQNPDYIEQQTEIKLQESKTEKLSQNTANYNERLRSGVIYGDNKFDCDDRACIRINGQYLKNLKNPADSIEWFDFDYNPVILTLDDFEELVDKVIAINREIEVKNCEINTAIKEAKTIDELEQINLDYSLIY